MFNSTPLDSWVAAKAGLGTLSRDGLNRYQLRKLRETLRWAQIHSPFYAQRLRGVTEDDIESLSDVEQLPFTTARDLREDAGGFLCVSQSEVSRVVTLKTSGTSGEPKRVYFTAADQELAIDFFHHGMSTLAEPGDRVLIALPHERSGSVGDLLAAGVRRLDATPVAFGPVVDPACALAVMARENVACAVGVPTELLAAARCDSLPKPRLRSVALCGDHVPASIVQALKQEWGCEVFEHYGSTEMGLGGGVDCAAHDGYHLREADLYFEIVSPANGAPAGPGEYGAVVFTTLTRRGMPLIRYRTGDISRLLSGRCACGSLVQRLERVRRRTDGQISLGPYGELSIAELDEALFAVPGVTGFTAAIDSGTPATLKVDVCAPHWSGPCLRFDVKQALRAVPAIQRARAAGVLDVIVQVSVSPAEPAGGKRRIQRWAA